MPDQTGASSPWPWQCLSCGMQVEAAEWHVCTPARLGVERMAAMGLDPVFVIPEGRWQNAGPETPESPDGDDTRLLCTVYVNGTPMHATAYLVDARSSEQAFLGAYGDEAEDVLGAVSDYGPWLTTTIRGREYAVIITPHCD